MKSARLTILLFPAVGSESGDYMPWSSKRISEVYKEAELNLHVGSILGFPGKVPAFISCLVATSLPVTGFYVWWFRGRKKGKLV